MTSIEKHTQFLYESITHICTDSVSLGSDNKILMIPTYFSWFLIYNMYENFKLQTLFYQHY